MKEIQTLKTRKDRLRSESKTPSISYYLVPQHQVENGWCYNSLLVWNKASNIMILPGRLCWKLVFRPEFPPCVCLFSVLSLLVLPPFWLLRRPDVFHLCLICSPRVFTVESFPFQLPGVCRSVCLSRFPAIPYIFLVLFQIPARMTWGLFVWDWTFFFHGQTLFFEL